MHNPRSFSVLSRNENIRSHYLLEASAGTGKTFTIENLVVRFLIEEPRLKISEILLVTFTRMATRELKQRISHQIDKALEILQHKQKNKAFDYLQPWIDDEVKLKQAKRALEDALASFDEAQIFTIHSFCEKMLNEYGENIEIHLSQGQISSKMLLQLIHNYYRLGMKEGKLSAGQLKILLKHHKQDLSKLDQILLKLVKGSTPIESQLTYTQLVNEANDVLKKMPSLNFDENELNTIFLTHLFQFKKDGLKITQEEIEKSIRILTKVMIDRKIDQSTFDMLLEQNLEILTIISPDNIKKTVKKLIEHPLIPFIDNLCSSFLPILEKASDPLCILAAVASDLQKVVKHYLEEEEKYRFDDLLDSMVKALSSQKFVENVSKQYKAVIIDEFQDTDKQQWKIFQTLFHHPHCHLYLVGDPKQSIYAFRQADIYTYLAASKTLGDNCLATLDTNYRSQPPLVEALNAFFMQTFDLISLPATSSHLPFHPVKAGCLDVLPFDDEKKAMHCWIMEHELGRSKKWPTEDIEESYIFPTICQEIIRMQRSYGVAFDRWALLIKDRYQGKRLLEFLQAHGVKAISQKEDSLADSAALPLFKELIHAVVHPKDESKVKIALCSSLFNVSMDEINLEEGFEKFLHWRSVFYNHGIAALLSDILSSKWENNTETTAEKLLRQQEGETIFRDVGQIVEILSQYENTFKATPQQIVNYLQNFEELELIDEDHIKIRQDAERGAVNILTMHMSKGLEFDFVVTLGAASRVKNKHELVLINQVLTPCDEEDPRLSSFYSEIDAEKMRQLYVGMTRAKYRLYLPVVLQSDRKKEIKLGEASPLELYFKKILGDKSSSFDEVHNRLSSLPHTSVSAFEDKAEMAKQELPVLLSPPQISAYSLHHKYVSSFSSLSKGTHDTFVSISSPQNFDALDKNCHTLPAGMETGLLLHSLLENLPLSLIKKACSAQDIAPFVEGQLKNSSYNAWSHVLSEILWKTLTTPLPPSGWILQEIDENQCFREIEFFFECPKGYMKGFIDFVFQHQGYYYIVDWKSNWLGENDDAYSQQALKASMDAHQYHLQAEIYQEALRRYLRIFDAREFENCFGGTYYLFLRGINTKEQQGIYHIPYQEISYVNG